MQIDIDKQLSVFNNDTQLFVSDSDIQLLVFNNDTWLFAFNCEWGSHVLHVLHISKRAPRFVVTAFVLWILRTLFDIALRTIQHCNTWALAN